METVLNASIGGYLLWKVCGTIMLTVSGCAAAYAFYLSRPSSRPSVSTHSVVLLKEHVKKHSSDVEQYRPLFTVEQQPLPNPKSGQVLVKIERSPINPSDLSCLRGTYNAAQREGLPCKCGFEGSGVVVQTGGGVLAGRLMGKRVGVVTTGGGQFWAEYATVTATQCIVLPDNVSFEEGSSCFVNPLTAIAFIEIAQKGNHKVILHTAAASALGKMVLKLGMANGIDVICIVRRQAQADTLRALGAKYVISTGNVGDNENEPKWENELKVLCKSINCTLGFDAVAGELVGKLLRNMPANSSIKVYGGLSEQPVSKVLASDLIFQNKKVEGFWLTGYLKHKNLLAKMKMLSKVQKYLKSCLSTDVRKSYSLNQVAEALADYNGDMSSGKICIAPTITE